MYWILCEERFRSHARSTSPVRPRCLLHGSCTIPPLSFGLVAVLSERRERCSQRNLWVRFWICSTTKAIRWNESEQRWRRRVHTTTTFETPRDLPSTRTSCEPHDTREGWTRRWVPWKRRDAPPMGVGRRDGGEDGCGNGGRCDHSDTRTTCISIRRGPETNPFDVEVDGILSVRAPPVALFSRRTSSRFVGRPFVFSRSKASGGAFHDDRGLEFDRRGRAGELDPSRTSDPLTQTRRRRTFASCGWTGAHSTVSRCVGSRPVLFASGAVLVCPRRRTRFRPLPSEAKSCQFDLRNGRGRFHAGVVAQFPRCFRVLSITRNPDRHVCGSRSSEHPLVHVLPDRRKSRGKRPPGEPRPRRGTDHVTAGIRFARMAGEEGEWESGTLVLSASGSFGLAFPFDREGFPFQRSGDPGRPPDRNRDERKRTRERVDPCTCCSTAHRRTRHACACIREVRLHDRETRTREAVEEGRKADGSSTKRRRKEKSTDGVDKVQGRKKESSPQRGRKKRVWIASQGVANGRIRTCTCTCHRRIEEGSIESRRQRKGEATRKERFVLGRIRRSSQRG